MTKDEYKDYFQQNNLKGNNYETAKFIKFLMGKKAKGKEVEELTGIKHSQITSYKKIINSGKIEDLKNKSISKVFKSIEKSPKVDKEIIYGIENLNLGDFSDKSESEGEVSEDEEELSWEENLRRLAGEHSNDYTDELELWIGDLESQALELNKENKRLKRRRSVGEDEEQKRVIEEQKKTIEEQKKTIEELRSENTSLLAYKKFFEEMREKMGSFGLHHAFPFVGVLFVVHFQCSLCSTSRVP